ncbi:NADH-quinone oxidoreductase subunit L [mine drainage metagenome]|uniref:NADH-quinone oxidoreductase subunit L n=1 Tax=mine drainage metagenome TaxID=410659 RepID=A0A1J5Q044_9ZZZZ
MGMHHDQDIRNMGGLRKYMPITWITSLIGSLALIGTPFLSGFYSKDSIIEAAKLSTIAGSGFAYFAVLSGVFVTAFYSFRMYFMVFHGKERWMEVKPAHGHDDHDHHHGLGPHDVPHESPWVVWLPMVALAIPSLAIGYFAIEPMLFGDFFHGAIVVNPALHPVMHELAKDFHGATEMGLHAFISLPFLLAASGVALSWFFVLRRPDIPAMLQQRFSLIYRMLENKYGFDAFNEAFFAGGARLIGGKLWQVGDVMIIDGFFVNGTARLVGRISLVVRRLQSGLIYHYAFAMIIGAFLLLTFFMKN